MFRNSTYDVYKTVIVMIRVQMGRHVYRVIFFFISRNVFGLIRIVRKSREKIQMNYHVDMNFNRKVTTPILASKNKQKCPRTKRMREQTPRRKANAFADVYIDVLLRSENAWCSRLL